MKETYQDLENEHIKGVNCKEIINAYEKYIKVLENELSDCALIANIHGWKSTRINEGVKCRKKINELKGKLKFAE